MSEVLEQHQGTFRERIRRNGRQVLVGYGLIFASFGLSAVIDHTVIERVFPVQSAEEINHELDFTRASTATRGTEDPDSQAQAQAQAMVDLNDHNEAIQGFAHDAVGVPISMLGGIVAGSAIAELAHVGVDAVGDRIRSARAARQSQ